MTESEILEWLAVVFEEPAGSLTRATPREDIPAWDSVGTLSLMAELDGRFGVLLSDADLRGLSKVGDVLDVLARHGHVK